MPINRPYLLAVKLGLLSQNKNIYFRGYIIMTLYIKKENTKSFTFKDMVDAYYFEHYGKFDFQGGENAPKLGKQIKKALGFEESQSTLQAWSELQTVFEELDTKELFVEKGLNTDLPTDETLNDWAFNQSCNSLDNSLGGRTVEFFRENLPEMKYMKIYSDSFNGGNTHVISAMRAYFISDGENFGHAGSYLRNVLTNDDQPSNFYTTLYLATSLLINYLYFGSRFLFEDMVPSNGLNILGNECDGVWANIGDSTNYKKFQTAEDFMEDLGEYFANDNMVYCPESDTYLEEDSEYLVYSEYHDIWIDTSHTDCIYVEKLVDFFLTEEDILKYLNVTYY